MPFAIDRHAHLITAAREQMQASQFKQAQKTCLEILATQPDYLEALIIVGLASLNLGATNTAELHLSEALRFQPDDADLHCNLGIALSMQCELKRAENEFKKAVNLQPDHKIARKHLEQAAKADLEFMFGREFKSRGRGSITVFPSYLPHRVTPVTPGSRMCLVTWVDGPPFVYNFIA